jgi:hypothetical protein
MLSAQKHLVVLSAEAVFPFCLVEGRRSQKSERRTLDFTQGCAFFKWKVGRSPPRWKQDFPDSSNSATTLSFRSLGGVVS